MCLINDDNNIRYFDVNNQTIIDNDNCIQLSPKAFDLLKYLYEHPNQLVSKSELLDKIWHGTVTVEAVIKNTICEIRKSLRDHSGQPKFVQTVHRRGYRFIGSNQLLLTDTRANASNQALADDEVLSYFHFLTHTNQFTTNSNF